MTTWPPRWRNAIEAMADLQHHTWLESMEDKVHFVLVLSREEFPQPPEVLISSLEAMNVEIIWDEENIKNCENKSILCFSLIKFCIFSSFSKV